MAQPVVPAGGAPTPSAFAAQLAPDKKAEVIVETYKKHASELLAIEESQQKMVLLLLGVFAAGISYVGTKEIAIPLAAKAGLIAIALILVGHGFVYTRFRNGARRGTRTLLVNCEHALGLYENGIYIQGAQLNPPGYANFPQVGDWLGWMSWFAILAAALAFILLVTFR
jgi:hypothetical protein